MSRTVQEIATEMLTTGLTQHQLSLMVELLSANHGLSGGQKVDPVQERRRAWDRERKRKQRSELSDIEWASRCSTVLKRDNFTCTYCGTTENIEVDHIVPIKRGGTFSIENLAACCSSCNSSKGARLLSEWLPTRSGKQTMSADVSGGMSTGQSVDADTSPLLTSSLSLETEEKKGTSEKGRKKEKVSGSARGTRLSPVSLLTLSDLDFALSAGLTEAEARDGWVEFLDYWVTIPGQRGVKLDWSATWRNNVRRVVKFKAGKPNAKTTGVIASADKLIDRIAAFDRPAQPQLSICGGTDAPDVRLLPEGGRERP